MDLNLKDKHVLITGGSKGIGLACAAAFLQEGAWVTLTERLDKAIETDARNSQITKETALARMVEKLPLGRIAEPHEVANAVVFLASSRASYINGVNLMMDGSLVSMI